MSTPPIPKVAAAYCGNSRTEDRIELVPHRNGGSTGDGRGFHSLDAREDEIPASAPAEELGRRVLEAFARCTEVRGEVD